MLECSEQFPGCTSGAFGRQKGRTDAGESPSSVYIGIVIVANFNPRLLLRKLPKRRRAEQNKNVFRSEALTISGNVSAVKEVEDEAAVDEEAMSMSVVHLTGLDLRHDGEVL